MAVLTGRRLDPWMAHYHAVMACAPASGHGLVRAPDGLGFVQDFINTGYVGLAQPVVPLIDLDDARARLSEALRLRAVDLGPTEEVAINDGDVERLRDLRATLKSCRRRPG